MDPLHYKIIISKRRLHIACLLGYAVLFTEIFIGFTFFRQPREQIIINGCSLNSVLKETVLMLVVSTNFIIFFAIMVVSYIILTIRLTQKKKKDRVFFTTSSNHSSARLTRSSWAVVTAFIVLYFPAITTQVVTALKPQPDSLPFRLFQDICNLLYFMNNCINPFLYFVTMRDFRRGYKSLIMCKKVKSKPKWIIIHGKRISTDSAKGFVVTFTANTQMWIRP